MRRKRLASKISKAVAVYLPARLIGTETPGTCCSKCRDFIKSTSECLITIDSKVSGPNGTCTQFIKGQPYDRAKPLKLVPKEVVGYIEGDDVPGAAAVSVVLLLLSLGVLLAINGLARWRRTHEH